jgi:hypothetical protein
MAQRISVRLAPGNAGSSIRTQVSDEYERESAEYPKKRRKFGTGGKRRRKSRKLRRPFPSPRISTWQRYIREANPLCPPDPGRRKSL